MFKSLIFKVYSLFCLLLLINCNNFQKKSVTKDINEIIEENNLGKAYFESCILPYINENNIRQSFQKNPQKAEKIIELYRKRIEELHKILGGIENISIKDVKKLIQNLELENKFSVKDLIADLNLKPNFLKTLIFYYLKQSKVDEYVINKIKNHVLLTSNPIKDNEEKQTNSIDEKVNIKEQVNVNNQLINNIDFNYTFNWQYLEKGPNFEIWIDIPKQLNKLLERNYRSSKQNIIEYKNKNTEYILNLDTLVQTNIQTGNIRKLRRNSNKYIKIKRNEKDIYIWQFWEWQSSNIKIRKDYGGTWINMNEISDKIEYLFNKKESKLYIPFKGVCYFFDLSNKEEMHQQNLKTCSEKQIRRINKYKECDICQEINDWSSHFFNCQKPDCDKLVCLNCIKKTQQNKKYKNKCPYCTNSYLKESKFCYQTFK
ncbi:MAG: WWE domain-containing protein [Bacteroidetes bacterium]|nr:WWE domain-containing protein [Bacteroidota bacterium]